VARALDGVEALLIVGRSSAKLEFFTYLAMDGFADLIPIESKEFVERETPDSVGVTARAGTVMCETAHVDQDACEALHTR
jgi:hypothetical protein